VGLLAFAPWAWGGSHLLHRARRRLALRVQEVRAEDARPPLLLIRSFADDDLGLDRRHQPIKGHLRFRLTLEEFVVDRLWELGPVIAIGRPWETLSPVGAAREYITGPNWRDRVLAGLDECSWVVSVLGDSEGLIWEYDQILMRQLDERLILVFPPRPHIVINQRWGVFRDVFPPAARIDLPDDPKVGLPLLAVFPRGVPSVLFCCKFRNETAYTLAFDELFARLAGARIAGNA
jgi:hypothetical protein